MMLFLGVELGELVGGGGNNSHNGHTRHDGGGQHSLHRNGEEDGDGDEIDLEEPWAEVGASRWCFEM